MKARPVVDGLIRCAACGRCLPADREHFHDGGRGRLSSYCKPCAIERASAHHAANRDRHLADMASYRRKHAAELRAYYREYAERNGAHRSAVAKEWRRRQGDRLKPLARKAYQANKAAYVERARRWAAEHPEQAREHTLRKNHRRRGAEQDAAARAYLELIKADPCAYCGARVEAMEVEHIVPLSRGGDGHWENLAMACRTCNAAKAGAPLLIFMWRRVS